MATLNHRRTESHEVEIFKIDLDEAELSALRADPHNFLRETLESSGHKVNRVMVEARLLQDIDECPNGLETVHWLNPPGYFSTWSLMCAPPPP